jgi:hypothetical protein
MHIFKELHQVPTFKKSDLVEFAVFIKKKNFKKEKSSIAYISVFLLGRNQPEGAGPVGAVQAVQ